MGVNWDPSKNKKKNQTLNFGLNKQQHLSKGVFNTKSLEVVETPPCL